MPFAAEGTMTSVGALTQGRYNSSGVSSQTTGYSAGGEISGNVTKRIDRFSFQTDGNAVNVVDLTAAAKGVSGNQV